MEKPIKPNFYYTTHIVIYLFVVIVAILAAIYVDDSRDSSFSSLSFFLISIFLIQLISPTLFREYKKQIQEFYLNEWQSEADQKRKEKQIADSESNKVVMKNIAKYNLKMKEKRKQAKWWQVWI